MDARDSEYELLAHDRLPHGNGGPIGRLPSLTALRVFETVARLKSVKAAADELCVTRSAVYHQIGRLEDDIGVALLERDGDGWRLTAEGLVLDRSLEHFFGRVAEAVDRIRRPARGSKLRVRAGVMFASAWLIPRLEAFHRVMPDTNVMLVGMDDSADWSGQTDVAIDWGTFKSDASVVAEKLSNDEEIFPVCRPGVCRDGGLAGATLLHLARAGRSRHWPEWPEFLAAVNLSDAPVGGRRLSAGMLWRAVRNGEGVALSCSTLARDDIRSGDLVRPIGESIATEAGYWIMTPRTALDRPEVGIFRKWLLDELATRH